MTDPSAGPSGAFRKVDPAVLDDDPFWGPVRRRHPDLDVVLLAPAAAAEPATPVGGNVVRARAARLVAAWREVAPSLADRGVTQPPTVRWARGPKGRQLRIEKAVRGIGAEAGTDLLREVAVRLGRQGWELAPSTREGRPLLRATDQLVSLEGTAGEAASVLALHIDLSAVSAEDEVAVRDSVAAQVASWAR